MEIILENVLPVLKSEKLKAKIFIIQRVKRGKKMDKQILLIATERKIFTYLLKRHTTAYENPVTSDGTNTYTFETRKKNKTLFAEFGKIP